MKKRTLLILVLTVLSLPAFAGGMQATGWAWINDDSDAESATFMTPQNLTPIEVMNDGAIRLRIRFDNMDTGNHTTTGLKYFAILSPTNISGNNAVLIDIGPGAYFDWVSSDYVSDGTPVETRNITYNSVKDGDFQATFSTGIFVSSSQTFTVPSKSSTEIEYCIKTTSNIVGGTYYFMPGGSEVSIWPESSNLETFPELTYVGTSVKNVHAKSVSVASSEGSVKLTALSVGLVHVVLVNTLGQSVKEVSTNSTDGQLTIYTNGMAKGLYIVQINGVTCQKVIIN